MRLVITRSTIVETTAHVDLDYDWDKFKAAVENDADLDFIDVSSKEIFINSFELGQYTDDQSVLFDRLVNYGWGEVESDEYGESSFQGSIE